MKVENFIVYVDEVGNVITNKKYFKFNNYIDTVKHNTSLKFISRKINYNYFGIKLCFKKDEN